MKSAKTKRNYQTPKLKKIGTLKSLTRAFGGSISDGMGGQDRG